MGQARTKMKRCGNILKFVEYEHPIWYGSTGGKKVTKPNYVLDDDGNEFWVDKETGEMLSVDEKKMSSRKQSTHRARNELIDKINANFTSGDKFLTLTYAENMQDITKAKRHINDFFMKVREKYPSLKYTYVIEFQQRGAIHFHVIMNAPYFKAKQIEEMWKRGFIKINRISHVKNVGAYVVKYMTKEGVDERLIGRKLYQCSQNCIKPSWDYGVSAELKLRRLEKKGQKKSYTTSYETERNGIAVHKEFNLND
ncbi:rolling circle replication-associated protein [Bacillus wiedmannii]|uniref:rolling circle replication-associated protein n=1 Tax=Bacillus wiedmannii TaxID=1890302 RepID=UPI0007CB3BE3|nr:hypothetical protein [Bacillus wiedmannii]OAK32600.1 hypothetical protein A6284_28320 [Bacillus wiedmannii]HDR7642642.1 hypothetical protein [Bacillus wiedmannii]